jgi:hypothetical protein
MATAARPGRFSIGRCCIRATGCSSSSRSRGLNHRQLALLRHALSHSGFRYAVLSHQNSHGVSHQTARSDLQKLATRGLLTAGKDGRREVFRVPEELAMRLPG